MAETCPDKGREVESVAKARENVTRRPHIAKPQGLLDDIQLALPGRKHPHAVVMRTCCPEHAPWEDQGMRLCAMCSLRVP